MVVWDALSFTGPLGKDERSAIYNGVDALEEIVTLAGLDLPGGPVGAVINRLCDGLPPPGLDVVDTGHLPRADYTVYEPLPASPHDCAIYAAAYAAIEQQLKLLGPHEHAVQQLSTALGEPLQHLVEHAIAAAYNAVKPGPMFDRLIASLPALTQPVVTVAIRTTDDAVRQYEALMLGLFVGIATALRQMPDPVACDGWEKYVLGRHVDVFGVPVEHGLLQQCLDAAFQPERSHAYMRMSVLSDTVAIAKHHTVTSIESVANAYRKVGVKDVRDVSFRLCGAFLACA